MVGSGIIDIPQPLAAGIRRGDRLAYESFVDELTDTLERHATAIVRDRSAAQDVVQQTFLAVWEGRERLPEPDGRLRAYCFGIMLNLARKYVHKDRLRAKRESEAATGRRRVDSGRSPAASLVAHEAWEAAQKLSPQVRDVVILRCGIGLTLEETAKALRIPVGTVATRQRRGLQQLRERLGVSVGAAIPPILGLGALFDPLKVGAGKIATATGTAGATAATASAGSSAVWVSVVTGVVAVVSLVAVVNPFAPPRREIPTDDPVVTVEEPATPEEPDTQAQPVPEPDTPDEAVSSAPVPRDVRVGFHVPVPIEGRISQPPDEWMTRARALAATHERASPVLLVQASDCLVDGTCRFAFAAGPDETIPSVTFATHDDLDLDAFARAAAAAGVEVLLTVDTGIADPTVVLARVHREFVDQSSVIGIVVRTRWVDFVGTPDGLGRPITRDDVIAWRAALPDSWGLWLMDWRADSLPAAGSTGVQYLGAARDFTGAPAARDWRTDWQQRFTAVGFAVGYDADRHWWSADGSSMTSTLADAIESTPAGGCVIWMTEPE